ncbi:MAG: hypothetical protein AAFU70_13130, partial [Planctomycetota bacterium]
EPLPPGILSFGVDLLDPGGNSVSEGTGVLTPGVYTLSSFNFSVNYSAADLDLENFLASGQDFFSAAELTLVLTLPAPGAAGLLSLTGLLATRRRR